MGEEYKEDKKMKKQNKKQAKRNAMFRKLRKYVKEKYDKEIAKKEKKLGRTLEKKEKIKIVDGIVNSMGIQAMASRAAVASVFKGPKYDTILTLPEAKKVEVPQVENSKKEIEEKEEIKENITEENAPEIIEESKEEIKEEVKEEVKDTYIDNNPIKLGIFLSNNNYYNKEVIEDTYYTNLTNWVDIGSFEVFLTDDKTINGTKFKDTWQKYYDKYEDINKYKIGYNIGYTLKDGTSNNSTFLEPDIFRYSKYFYIYFYDDVNAPNGFYSHLENVNDNTLMTSVKLYAVDEIDEVESITLTAFTYDEDDFDKENNYRGNSKYTINIKRK